MLLSGEIGLKPHYSESDVMEYGKQKFDSDCEMELGQILKKAAGYLTEMDFM